MGSRKKAILHLVFTITNYTCRMQKGTQLQFCYSICSLLSGFSATVSESLQWRLVLISTSTTCSSLHMHHGSSRLIDPVPHCICTMELAGSLITHIDKLSSPQPRCLLKGQQDANDLQDFTVFKSHPETVTVRFHPSGSRLLRPLLLPTLIRCSVAGIHSYFKEKPHPFQLHILA